MSLFWFKVFNPIERTDFYFWKTETSSTLVVVLKLNRYILSCPKTLSTSEPVSAQNVFDRCKGVRKLVYCIHQGFRVYHVFQEKDLFLNNISSQKMKYIHFAVYKTKKLFSEKERE